MIPPSTPLRPPASPSLTGALLRQFTLRHWRLFPSRSLLLLLLLSLGIAVFLSIRLANRAAVSSFTNFTEVLTRQSDLILSSPAGPLPEAILDTLRARCKLPQLISAHLEIVPVVETICAQPQSNEANQIGSRSTFTLLGVDLVALQNFAAEAHLDTSWAGQKNASEPSAPNSNSLEDLLHKNNAAFCSSALAQRLSLQVGSLLSVILNDREVQLEIVGIIPHRADQPSPPAGLLVMDLPALQTLSDKVGLLDRIELFFPTALKKGPLREQLVEQISTALAPSINARTPVARQAAAELMTRGFRLNLTILSLLSLLVGLYLIFQALDAAVVRRRAEIAILRALGVREWEVRRAWLWEAALLGAGGGIVGVLGGWALAQVAVRAVSKTVNALYYANNAEAAGLHGGEALGAFVLSVGCSILAGWLPAKRAASIPPAQAWAQGSATPAENSRSSAQLGWGLVVLAIMLAFLPPLRMSGGSRFALAGYLSALLGVVGAGLIAGDALKIAAWCG